MSTFIIVCPWIVALRTRPHTGAGGAWRAARRRRHERFALFSSIAEQGKISLVVEATFFCHPNIPLSSMLPLLIFDAFYFHDEWGPNELSHTTESETGLIPVKYKCHINICSISLCILRPIHNYLNKMKGGRGSKNVFFCSRSGYKNCPRGGGVKEWQASVPVVIECPLAVFGSIFAP